MDQSAFANTTTYAYNDNGQVTEETLPNTNDGSVPTTYCYDSDGNLVGETSPDGSTESWTYTTINNTYGGKLDAVATYTDGLGCETIYNYATTPYPVQAWPRATSSRPSRSSARRRIRMSNVEHPIRVHSAWRRLPRGSAPHGGRSARH